MAMHKCQCVECQHKFYWLSVDCREDTRVYCPICQGMTEVEDLELPEGERWAECTKGSCGGCGGCENSRSV